MAWQRRRTKASARVELLGTTTVMFDSESEYAIGGVRCAELDLGAALPEARKPFESSVCTVTVARAYTYVSSSSTIDCTYTTSSPRSAT